MERAMWFDKQMVGGLVGRAAERRGDYQAGG
jgi:hypothetical protein